MGRRFVTNKSTRNRPENGRGADAARGEQIPESQRLSKRAPDKIACETSSDSKAADDLLSPAEAARRLGVTVTTLYDWLGRSDRGLLVIRGLPVTVEYLQGGPAGQGRIRIERREAERVRELMRVRPQSIIARRPPTPQVRFPGITVPLGRPSPSF